MRHKNVTLLTAAWTLACFALFAAVQASGGADAVEQPWEDFLLCRGVRPKLATKILLLEIDAASLREERLAKPPWRPAVYARVLRRLADLGARQVAFDVLLEHVYEPADQELATAIRDCGIPVVLASEWSLHRDHETSEERWTLPARAFRKAAAAGPAEMPRGFINLPLHGDAIRQAWLFRPDPLDPDRIQPSLAYALARNLGSVRPPSTPQAAPREPVLTRRGPIPLAGNDPQGARMRIFYCGPPGTFWRVSVQQLLYPEDETAVREAVAGATVLVGATAAEYHDLHATPINGVIRGEKQRMPGVEVHANILNTLCSGQSPQPADFGLTLTVVGIAIIPFLLILLNSRPSISLLALPVWVAGLAWTGQAIFNRWLLILPFGVPLLTLAAIWGGGVAIRWATVDRDRYRLRGLLGRCLHESMINRLMGKSLDEVIRGEERNVTVFFCDIRSFTKLSERLRPEEVVERLRAYFEAMGEVIYAHQGAVDKFIGDAIMAFFGTPQDDEHHARSAVRCALAMRERLEALNREWEQRGWDPIEIGFGISSGSVVAGMLGSPQKLEYTVIGDAVNVASRLESMNKELGSTLLISGQTRRLLGPGFELEDKGSLQVRGKALSVRVYSVRGEQGMPAEERTPTARLSSVVAPPDASRWKQELAAAIASEEKSDALPK